MATEYTNQYRHHAITWSKLVIALLVVQSIISAALAVALGMAGVLISVLISALAAVFLSIKLFEHVDSLILTRIKQFQ